MGDEKRAPTADQLRKAIDRGQAADKTPGADPAAAPLGTDAEAGGSPPTPEKLAMEAEAVPRADPSRPTAGGEASESLRASETREAVEKRPSEGGGAAESVRGGRAIPSREDEAAGALSDDPAPPRQSAEP